MTSVLSAGGEVVVEVVDVVGWVVEDELVIDELLDDELELDIGWGLKLT